MKVDIPLAYHLEIKKVKREEKITTYIFWAILFMLIFFSLKYYYDLKTSNYLYKGKYFNYYYNNAEKFWETYYYSHVNNKTYIVPFESDPRNFENYTYRVIRPFNNNPEYIILVYENKTNYQYIAKASLNLASVLNAKGYYSYLFTYPGILINKTILILSKNMSIITKGPLDCNLNKGLFILLFPESNKNTVIFNGSCIYIYGNREEFFNGVNFVKVILLRYLNEKND